MPGGKRNRENGKGKDYVCHAGESRVRRGVLHPRHPYITELAVNNVSDSDTLRKGNTWTKTAQ